MHDFVDKTETKRGTKLNRYAMMAVQGFIPKIIEFGDKAVIEINELGQTLTTTFNDDGSITEMFVGDKMITKTITFNENTITEEVTHYELG